MFRSSVYSPFQKVSNLLQFSTKDLSTLHPVSLRSSLNKVLGTRYVYSTRHTEKDIVPCKWTWGTRVQGETVDDTLTLV